ncbi:hypothetical protein OG470_15240 [Micromonospora sp. NBC_00389]|uniref:hypothetical protein n=1 Tax=Micromonospora sp. NBC_00389 TaxID=2903586 RepID=UPI002E1F2143
MAHATRGHRSGTYEIERINKVDKRRLSITFQHAAAYQPQVVTLHVDHTPAAEQMLQAMADSIKVGDNGDADSAWESSETLRQARWQATTMLNRLAERGFDTFADARLDVATLRWLYEPMHSNTKRSACWLLARAVRDNHPNGVAISRALKNSRFQVEESTPFIYDDAVSDAIEAAAKAVYTEYFTAQREIFERLGYDVTGREWLRVPAQELIDWAVRAQPDVSRPGAPQPSLVASYEQQIAWALTHPRMFGYIKYNRTSPLRGPQIKAIGRALYPDNILITAALILHCLGENSGFNASVLLQKDADTLTFLGSDHALEHNVKARNHSEDTRPTRLTSIYTSGGVVETMTGLTRFARHSRRDLITPAGTLAAVVDRLYVEHASEPVEAQVINEFRRINAWKSPIFDKHWDGATAGPRSDVSLRLSALRYVAQRRAMGEGLTADVHGHTPSTKLHYTAHVLPDHVFNKHATAAQNAFHDDAVAGFTVVADATEGPAADLAAVDPDEIMDVEIGVCTSGGNAPDGSGRRCDLGMVACFTCPNGYRTIDHVPGLLAAVELGDIIERNDPVEWEHGQASHLRFYSQACLDKFPPMVVGNIKRSTDLVPHILTVTGMYMEMRHG